MTPHQSITNKQAYLNSYQIDQGELENDLRCLNAADGVDLLEGMKVQPIFERVYQRAPASGALKNGFSPR